MSDARFFHDMMDLNLPISKVTIGGDYMYTAGLGEPFDIKAPKPGMRKLFRKMKALMAERGVGFADVVKVTALLCGPGVWKDYCDVYAEFFKPPYPCRTTIPVVGDKPFLELDFVIFRKGLSQLACNGEKAAGKSMRLK